MRIFLNGEPVKTEQTKDITIQESVNFLDNFDFTLDEIQITLPLDYYFRIKKITINRVVIKKDENNTILFIGYAYKPVLNYKGQTFQLTCTSIFSDIIKETTVNTTETYNAVDLLYSLISPFLINPFVCKNFSNAKTAVNANVIFDTDGNDVSVGEAVKSILELLQVGLYVSGTEIKLLAFPTIWPETAEPVGNDLTNGKLSDISQLSEYYYDKVALTYATGVGVDTATVESGTGDLVKSVSLGTSIYCTATDAQVLCDRIYNVVHRKYWQTSSMQTNIKNNLDVGKFIELEDFIFLIKGKTIEGSNINYNLIGVEK